MNGTVILYCNYTALGYVLYSRDNRGKIHAEGDKKPFYTCII